MASAGGNNTYTSEDAERRQHFFDSLAELADSIRGAGDYADDDLS